MTHYDSAAEDTEDRFYAQFDSREVKLMTLDELVEAFEAGEIHENTFVCREGESEWLTLSVVAGLGDEEEPEPAPVVERRPPMPNRAPQSVEMANAGNSRPPMPNRGPDLGDRRPPMPNRRPDLDAVPVSRQVSAYPPVAVRPAIAPSTPLSFAPVTSNINYADLDLDELSLRPKRRIGRVFAAAAALAVIGGGGAFAATGGLHRLPFVMPSMGALESAAGHSQASLTLSNIEAKPTPAPVAAPVAPPPAPEPVAAATPPAPTTPSDAPAATPAFSDDMKQALLAADKTHAATHAAKVKARAASPVAHRSGGHAGSSTGFKSGGSAYDPLNGKL
jgi:hypothetical protein